jgi:hypothetical protein
MTELDSTVVVTSDETLPDVIERVQGAASGGRTVNLVVPIDSPLLLTAKEFRTLNEAIDKDRLSVVLRTSDPLRLRLGERLGIRTQLMPRPAPKVVASVAVPAPPREAPKSVAGPDADGDGGEDGAPLETRQDPARLWPATNGAVELAGDDARVAPSEPEPERRTTVGNPPRRWLPVAAALVAIVVITFFAIRLVIPRAIVRIVPKSAPLQASLVFDVTGDGQPLDGEAAFAVKPEERELAVIWEGAAPVTGVRTEPDGTATGAIELRNASAEPVTVEAGTRIATETGVEFAVVAAVTVPPQDPATGKPGAATATVKAVNAGSSGLVGTGELGGRLPNGIYYSNRMEPTSGGTDKEFPIVAQADLDALAAQAKKAAPDLVSKALTGDGDHASDAVLSSIKVIRQDNEFDHKTNDDAESVALHSTLTVQVLTFDRNAAEAGYQQALAASLAAKAPSGYALDPAQIAFDAPVEKEQREGGFRLEVGAHVLAKAEMDEAERQSLADKLAGVSSDEAASILKQTSEIDTFTIEYEPTWLPRQMPKTAARIELEIAP